MDELIKDFWNRFLEKTSRNKNTTYMDVFYFELTEKVSNELLDLVLKGQKRATASSYSSYKIEGTPLPKKGDLSIVTNFQGVPKCVIQTKEVSIIPFKEITYDICKREGEDDTLESWQKGHIKFFTEEGKLLGYEFCRNMLVVFEDFEVVYTE